MKKNIQRMLEGSVAIAETIKNIAPAVVSAYPITPQTHIVEALAKFKADKNVKYEYVRAESEFAAASIILGASAVGQRVYSATSSQGLLLMIEVLFNIAGLRLPIVMTCANRAVGAPINIWNDQQDIMTLRDAGWILLFASTQQEAVDQHILAYKLAEKLNIPVMVNVDGYVLTHSTEPVLIPEQKNINKFLPNYKPQANSYLDPNNPVTLGVFITPEHYLEIRQELHEDLINSQGIIKQEYKNYQKIVYKEKSDKNIKINNGLIEYSENKKADTVLITFGSVSGTIKEVLKNKKYSNIGLLKIKCFRPWPKEEIIEIISKAKNIAVIEKDISLGSQGALAGEIKATIAEMKKSKIKNVKSYIVGLGGRDITQKKIGEIIIDAKNSKINNHSQFIG